jgi:hypothetical protein
VRAALAAQLVALVLGHHQRAQAGEGIAGDEAVRDQFPERLFHLRAEQPRVMLQVGEEAGAVRAQHVQHRARDARTAASSSTTAAPAACCQWAQGVAFAQQHRRAADRALAAGRRVACIRRPPPRHAPRGAQLVQHGRQVVG